MMRRALLALLMAFLATPVMADVVDGSYGNEEGCLYSETGESSGADVFFLLNKEGITTAASYCTFKGEPRVVDGKTVVTTDCEEEGASGPTTFDVTLTKENGAYTITFDDGSVWGPLKQCKK